MSFGNNPLWGKPEPRRKPVSQSARTKVLVRAKGKCEKCAHSLEDVKPHIHHRDGNPKNNKLSNLQVLCPNCHSKIHDKPIKKKPNSNNGNIFGNQPSFRL
jgi:5-methylcytosine-specific restriction endonuclease McrA